MTFALAYLRQRRKLILIFLLFCLIFALIFSFYQLPLGAVGYPALLCGVLGLLCLAWDGWRAWQQHRLLARLSALSASTLEQFPPPHTQEARDYQAILHSLTQEIKQRRQDTAQSQTELMDYYTLWAHQIKTPISSMRLTLQGEDTPSARLLSEDLTRIEQYVEMVLAYLRLDSPSTDYVFRPCPLDQILRGVIRKASTQFIRRRIALHYTPVAQEVLTDEKWLSFVVEQVLSNALKYTPDGGEITIEVEQPLTLCIRDTGMGIAPEDLPRIFEKGYTGCNGRRDLKASGLGLYLCRRVCETLGHTISAQSSPQGTTVRIGLARRELRLE